jgi:hypothetical protein
MASMQIYGSHSENHYGPIDMLNPDGTFNLSAILKLAHQQARRSQVRFNDRQTVPSYREAFRAALIGTWAQAKRERAAAMRSAEQVANDEEHVSRLFGAAMIDSTSRMLATVAQIASQRAELRA